MNQISFQFLEYRKMNVVSVSRSLMNVETERCPMVEIERKKRGKWRRQNLLHPKSMYHTINIATHFNNTFLIFSS